MLYAWRKRSTANGNPLQQSEAEHAEVLRLGETLERIAADDARWLESFEALRRLVALHFQDEEDQLFSAVRRELSHGERNAMGDRYERRRDELASDGE